MTQPAAAYILTTPTRRILVCRGSELRVSAYGAEKLLNAADPLADENRRLSILARRDDKPAPDRKGGPASVGLGGDGIAPTFAQPGTPPV